MDRHELPTRTHVHRKNPQRKQRDGDDRQDDSTRRHIRDVVMDGPGACISLIVDILEMLQHVVPVLIGSFPDLFPSRTLFRTAGFDAAFYDFYHLIPTRHRIDVVVVNRRILWWMNRHIIR
ncbi:MAG TPA: hypothetical protein VF817_00050 [Patescibacteria group bacterium]